MRRVIVGTEALESGSLTRYQLQQYARVLPGVYAPRDCALSLADRTEAAWLWSQRRAVIAGSAAAALHGAQWIRDDTPVELIWRNGRPPRGVVVRNERLSTAEVTRVAGLPVTTIARTVFDLGRHLPRGLAAARVDALIRAYPASALDLDAMCRRYRGARGLRRLQTLLPDLDAGAASPKETWLRLLIVDAGLPRPRTQIPLHDSRGLVAVFDMGWEEFKVAAEYDGDQHRTDRARYVWDQRRSRLVAALGWEVVRVIKEDHPTDVITRVAEALRSRGWRP